MRYRFACKQIQAGAGIFSIVRTIILTFLNLFELVFFIQGFMVTLYIHIIIIIIIIITIIIMIMIII